MMNTNANTNTDFDTGIASAAPVRLLRTPYHELGAGAPCVPAWAQHRSVYRAGGRTLYLVETDRLDAARRDLDALARNGWSVEIDRDGETANITLSRRAA